VQLEAVARHQVEQLVCGARLITAPLDERSSVSVALLFPVGSRYESRDEAGISHFLEHMVFKGSRKYPGPKEISEAIEGVGGFIDAATDKEVTMYWARVPADRVADAVDVICDLVSAPLLEPPEVEKERDVILEELRAYLDSPADHVHDLFDEQLWGDHALGVDVAGTAESVRGISAAQLRHHRDLHYRVSDLVVSVAGRFDHDELKSLLDRRLEALTSGERPGYPPSPAAPQRPGAKVELRDTEQGHIVLGARSFSYLHPDRFIVDILDTILGEGMGSRLFLEIRERRALCYDVHSWCAKLADSGAAGVYLGSDPGRAEDALDAVLGELRRLCREPVPDGELDKAVRYYKGRLLLHLEGTNALATWLGSQAALTGRIMTIGEIVAAVDAVTPADLQRVARETFEQQALQLAAVGPFAGDARLLARLNSQ
jgi:predicted Zn-dependent peptidase